MINKNTDISSTLKKLKSVKTYCDGSQNSFVAGFYFDICALEELDIFLLTNFMRFRKVQEVLMLPVLSNNNEPIIFNSESAAKGTLSSILPNLEKQLLFSIFRKTGVKFLPYVEPSDTIPINFIEL